MIDTRRTRRVPGRGFRGDSRAAGWRPGGLRLGRTRGTWRNRRHPGKTHSALGYTAHSGFREVFGSLGTRGGSEGSRRKGFRSALGDRWQTRATSGGNPPGAGHSGTRGSSGRIREVKCFALHSEHVAGSEGGSKKAFGGVSGRVFGDLSHFSKESFGSTFGTGVKSPKGGPAGASAGSSNGGIRQGFEKASKMGRVFRGHVSDSEGSPKESGSEGVFREGDSERLRRAERVFERFPRECLRRRFAKDSSGRASATGGYDRWIQNLWLGTVGQFGPAE